VVVVKVVIVVIVVIVVPVRWRRCFVGEVAGEGAVVILRLALEASVGIVVGV